jgi:hypothetical protein
MNRDEIIKTAVEAGASIRGHYDETGSTPAELQRFAELVAAAESEECAKVCQSVVDGGMYDGWQQYAAAACRDEIRARGK